MSESNLKIKTNCKSVKQIKGRFAPSPSGRMHLGNVYSALMSWLSARKQGGSWLLRIEDLDRQRCKNEYATLVMDDLRWLGLDWDEGACLHTENTSAPDSFFQSTRTAFYEEAFERLVQQGAVYDCFCRRADLLSASAPHASDGTPVYAGRCRNLTACERELLLASGKTPSKRLRVEDEEVAFIDGHYGAQHCNLLHDCGDFVIRRADANFAYQLAVVVDDALMGVTEVVRGRDLLLSTHQQLYLYKKLGYAFPAFFHLPLLVDSDGRRLSKRNKDIDMAYLRATYTKEALIGHIMHLCGFLPKDAPLSLAEALALFNWETLPLHDIAV